jgi:phenylpropionate dioxygenase-like ring-hydroxylating dioxygenase large terminal subunit
VTPIARELLALSLYPFGRSITLPAEAYTDWSVLRWEQEHFFDRSWVCVGRADGSANPGDKRVVAWHGWVFANAGGEAPPFEEHAGNLEESIRNYGCGELVVGARHDYEIAANWKILAENSALQAFQQFSLSACQVFVCSVLALLQEDPTT